MRDKREELIKQIEKMNKEIDNYNSYKTSLTGHDRTKLERTIKGLESEVRITRERLSRIRR